MQFLHADNEDSEAQADLSSRWAHISEGTFSYVVAHLRYKTQILGVG